MVLALNLSTPVDAGAPQGYPPSPTGFKVNLGYKRSSLKKRGGYKAPPLPEDYLGSLWLLGEEKDILFSGVATGKVPMLL